MEPYTYYEHGQGNELNLCLCDIAYVVSGHGDIYCNRKSYKLSLVAERPTDTDIGRFSVQPED